jgi:hypothetical protein
MERTDRLRKRPNTIRYYYLAVGEKNIHIGLSHAGLQKAAKTDNIIALYLSDVVTKKVQKITLEKFLDWWREHYQDPSAEYIE